MSEIRRVVIAGIAAAAASASACVGAAGTRPHDMSTAGHEEAAHAEEREAREHDALYDASVSRAERCRNHAVDPGGICWAEDINPNPAHRAEAERHRRAAAAHRAASQALREAEARACVGIDESDRGVSPFGHRDDIASVAALSEPVPGVGDEAPRERTAGVTIVFRAVPGMTAEWLQRLVDCHLARNAGLGHDVPEMPYCPLVLRGVSARVRSTGDGFAVDIRAEATETVAEILRRARALLREPGAQVGARLR